MVKWGRSVTTTRQGTLCARAPPHQKSHARTVPAHSTGAPCCPLWLTVNSRAGSKLTLQLRRPLVKTLCVPLRARHAPSPLLSSLLSLIREYALWKPTVMAPLLLQLPRISKQNAALGGAVSLSAGFLVPTSPLLVPFWMT